MQGRLETQRQMILRHQAELQQEQQQQQQQIEELRQRRELFEAQQRFMAQENEQCEAQRRRDPQQPNVQQPWLWAHLFNQARQEQPPPAPAAPAPAAPAQAAVPVHTATIATAAATAKAAASGPATPQPPGAPRDWESESASDRKARHEKYATMAASSDTGKVSIQQQSKALVKAVEVQEEMVRYLRSFSFDPPDSEEQQAMDKRIEDLLEAHADLTKHLEFIGVAYDHGWEAAKIFYENRKIGKSKEISAAVKEAKKVKDKKSKSSTSSSSSSSSSSSDAKKAKKSNNSGSRSANSGWNYWPAAAFLAAQQQQYQAPAAYNYSAPFQASNFGPQRRFGGQRNFFCFRCGENSHGWQNCPKPLSK